MTIFSVLTVTTPAYGEVRPRAEEWWFGTWDIQDKVWPITTGKGVTVAVIDSGVNAKVADLRGAVIPGTDIDAHKGDGRTDFDDQEDGHGTSMAALIAGQGVGTGMVGIAPDAKIMPIRAQDGSEELEDGIHFAVDHGAKVINISQGVPSPAWAGGCGASTEEAVSYALDHDVVIVASAGNDGNAANSPSWPAQCPGILAVGAVDYHFVPWFKTQRQPYVAAAAPGVHVGSITKEGVFHSDWNGTSQASALTAGVAALVRSKFPKMPAREVVQRIIATARDVGSSGRDNATGYGLVRPYHALVDEVTAGAPNPVFAAWDNSQAASHSSTSVADTTPATTPSTSKNRRSSQPSHTAKRSAMPTMYAAISILAILVAAGIYIFVRTKSRTKATRW